MDEEQTLNDAIAEATAEAKAEVEAGVEHPAIAEAPAEEVPAEETPAEEAPAEEAAEEKPAPERGEDGKFIAKEKPAEEVKEEPEPEGIDDHLTAEDLKAIEGDDRLLKAYKSMQRGLTKNRQGDSEKIKSYEEKAQMVDWMRDNPRRALEILAENQGIKLPDAKEQKEEKEAVSDTVDSIMDLAEKRVGKDAAKVLGPLVKDIAEMVATNIVRKQVDPLKANVEEQNATAARNSIKSEVSRFGASVQERGDEWNDEIVQEMANEMEVVVPADGADPQKYLEAIYDRVAMRRSRSTAKREQLRRLREAKQTSEPTTTVRPQAEQPLEITAEMDERDAIKLAVAQATKEATA
jgi:hypothetical protein